MDNDDPQLWLWSVDCCCYSAEIHRYHSKSLSVIGKTFKDVICKLCGLNCNVFFVYIVKETIAILFEQDYINHEKESDQR